jgi:hypothetical protein
MKQRRLIAAVLAMDTLLLSSCRKDEDQAVLEAVDLKNESLNSFVDKNLSADEEAASLKNMTGGSVCGWGVYFSDCASITEDSETFPKTITIDFGDGCTGPNGITRSGIMYVHLTAPMDETGAIRTVTFENYQINSISVTGSRVTTNLGANDDGHPQFSREVNIAFTQNGSTFTRQFSSVLTWLSGYDTEECFDNSWMMTGSGTGTRPDGTVVPRVITSPLYYSHECGYIYQGVMQSTPPVGNITVDYGNGTCDNYATVTGPNGNTFTIELNP